MGELLAVKHTPEQDATVKVEISMQLLAQFIEQGLLCVADLKCLDPDSRNQIKKLCLSVCARNPGCLRKRSFKNLSQGGFTSRKRDRQYLNDQNSQNSNSGTDYRIIFRSSDRF